MKKLKFLGLVAAVAGMFLLTSCLKGNNERSNTGFGLVDTGGNTMRRLVYSNYEAPMYIASVANDYTIGDGDCIIFNYKLDFDAADNANATTNGFYVATGSALQVLPKGNLSTGTPDTAYMYSNEILLSDAGVTDFLQSNQYRQRLIVGGAPSSYLTEQKNSYTLSCDLSQTPQTIQGVERVYTLFLRATKTSDGKAPAIKSADYTAFDAVQFYSTLSEREKNAGKDRISFCVKYASAFNSDTTKIGTWTTTTPVYIPIYSTEK
ncbi:hypothetical protein [Parabacteroides sp. AM08-6]|uniref:hypothetical protein n=1 Tax=Parabacteroides sp. AM08-6 TaxID=2292053 RepID=UPI0011C344F0|nr:hypothetical protein [Parabacteroides sp. AM08-6]